MDITHEPYDKYEWDEVLKPLSMTNSFFTQPPPKNKTAFLASGYDANGKEINSKYHIYPELAAAGLWTNPVDLSKFIIEICAHKRMKDETVHKKYGKHSLQDAGEIGAGKAWASL